jgi:hypothetical protein
MPGTTDPSRRDEGESSRWQRLGWFVLLYAAGLAVTLAVAYGLRSLVPGAGG